MALATLVLLPGAASAQTGSPPAVAGVVVERPAPVVLGETLPRTGSDLVAMAIIAGAMVLLGVLLVVSVRRRRTTDISLA